MNPIQFPGFNVTFGAAQPEYLPLPAYRNPDTGEVTACWEMTAEERAVVANTGCVYVTLLAFGGPLTPSRVSVTPPEGLPALAPDLVPAASTVLRLRPLSWDDSETESMNEKGFHIENDPTDCDEPDQPWRLVWGEGEPEYFATREDAKAQAEHLWSSFVLDQLETEKVP